MERAVAKCMPYEGAKLDVIEAKVVPKPKWVFTWILVSPNEPVKVLKRLVRRPGRSSIGC